MINTDDWVTTHDAARDLLRYSVIGGSVIIEPVWPPDPAARQWALVLDAAPMDTPSMGDIYALPVKADTLLRRVRTLADSAHEALTRRRAAVTSET